MPIAVISDMHDNVWKLAAALDAVRDAEALICCGDLCSPFIVHQIGRAFSRPVHIVFGNNDADLFRITANARKYPNLNLHGELFRGELAGRRIAAQHYDNIAREIAASGNFDVVCYGHNHIYAVERIGRALAINPGAIMGAAFSPDGTRADVDSTFVLYDPAADAAAGYRIVASAGGAFEAQPIAAGK